ncbi:flavin-containing monooxygenase FMO GS-OX-like 2 isoform X1 [Nicotiana tabacum]|uniref:Flavin-containing monooxygenase n=2 Tax=Nicotiana TaxID=4085 RepID=A0A1S3Z323_TOBAC|nr:PREDICTED: flavin-containing monooxygenase FMO GS-OX-like 2 [Nicotiana sylvestris]XP_016458567.1 PREDICTED: flavin-containing monooxygenase FMO GS-OX-like 2 isoform X1 [Nicotiana tabacum]
MAESRKVAVIGAGVAGLVTARELQRSGLKVTVFEKSAQLGGTWAYNPKIETDPLGLDPNRETIHSSLYKSLRTNLPRQLMSFSDYNFNTNIAENGKLINFPRHEEVLKFLNEFAKDFGITELIRFNTEVVRVRRVEYEEDRWVVELKTDELISEEVFDSVVVCNGHYTIPKVANIPGINNWPGKQIHSHNYRVPKPFKDQIVVVIGDGPSGVDISRDIATVAKQVHLSTRSSETEVSKLDNFANLWNHSKIDHVDESGEVIFLDGSSVHADIILHCTGYKYDFPFLETNGIVSVDDNRVGPLYKHVFPPKLSPSVSFVGIPYHTIIFLMFELQAKWIAQVLSGKVLLPSEEEMLADVEDHNMHLEVASIPKHHTHRLHPREIEYMDWLAAQVGMPPVGAGLKEIYWSLYKVIGEVGFSSYRDLWDFENLSQ